MQIYTRIHIPLLGALTAVGAGVHMLIQEAGAGDAQAGAAWALDGGAALYLLCLTIAQHVTERGADAVPARALAGVALVVLAARRGRSDPGEPRRLLGGGARRAGRPRDPAGAGRAAPSP